MDQGARLGTQSIYKSPAGREQVLHAYDEATAALGFELREHTVETRFGDTHVLEAGPADGPPVVSFHGGNSFNADTLSWYNALTEGYRVLAPDTIGHPGRSAETRLNPNDMSYGQWAADVFDGLGLDSAAALGTSYGAAIILRLASIAPERISRAILVVPAGLVKPKLGPMMKMTLPWLRYVMSPSRQRLVRMLQPMFADAPVDDEVVNAVGTIFRHVRIERGMPRPAVRAELADFDAPTLVLAGERCMFFPAARVVPAAEALIPNLQAAETISGSGHYPSVDKRHWLAERIAAFLLGG